MMNHPKSSMLETNGSATPPLPVMETDHLIVGAGPAGASLAGFLGQNGMWGTVISAASGCADTPRAHITNKGTLECLRDMGIEEECLNAANKGDLMLHARWSYSMAGEEFARVYSFGNEPHRKGDYDAASPCPHVDIPQTLLEPILTRHAYLNGFTLRWDTTFLSFAKDSSGSILSTIRDNLTGHEYIIKSKYLYGCDGGRSKVFNQLDIPIAKRPGGGLAISVLVEADLSHLMESRKGSLHWVMQPDRESPVWGLSAIVRMTKPWSKWIFVLFRVPGIQADREPTTEEYAQRIREIIGDDSIPFKITDVSSWLVNEIVAESYSDGNIFCLGDAVHRHPPFGGLGSNTGIQDAYNLAWKIAYVQKGLASSSLLDSYTQERQPVGEAIVARANQAHRDHLPIWEALGMLDADVAVRKQKFAELSAATPEGADRRHRLMAAVENTRHEFHGLGIEMGQRYLSQAVYLKDEADPQPAHPGDPVLDYVISTYPGNRLPHAWLNSAVPGKPISTIDLAGHGKFCLITGIGGQKWKDAAVEVGKLLGMDIPAYSIGWRRDYEDVYFDWARRREVDEDGCVLVRPDRFVAWRAHSMDTDCVAKLTKVMKSLLGRLG